MRMGTLHSSQQCMCGSMWRRPTRLTRWFHCSFLLLCSGSSGPFIGGNCTSSSSSANSAIDHLINMNLQIVVEKHITHSLNLVHQIVVNWLLVGLLFFSASCVGRSSFLALTACFFVFRAFAEPGFRWRAMFFLTLWLVSPANVPWWTASKSENHSQLNFYDARIRSLQTCCTPA